MGCGIQKGKVGSYRGVKTDVNLLPKLQVDVVVSEVDPGLVVAAAQRALHTGAAGDGKVFVSNVQDVLRISTGQTGTAALDMTTEVRDAR
jgi:Amt family ammonium transporter